MTQDTTIIQGQQPYESKTNSNNNNFEMDGIGKLYKCFAATIWPITSYKVYQTPLIYIDWMVMSIKRVGEPNHNTPCLCPV
jgi:hypothetical protein